jgi:hypothetical protein
LPKRRNRKYTKQEIPSRPEDWQEAMERGVFLLNERNRAFVDYVSPEVYLPPVSLRFLVLQVVLIVICAAFLVGWLYSLNHDLTQRAKQGGVSISAFWGWTIVVLGVAGLVSGAFVAYRLLREGARRRSLVLEGRLIFVPLTGCVITKRFLWDPQIHLEYELVSPETDKRLGGRYVGDWAEDRACPVEGMVAAVLFKDDRDYQVL